MATEQQSLATAGEMPPSLPQAGDGLRNANSNVHADTAGVNGFRSREAIPAACLGCRSRHQKCDGRNPCSRCVTSNSDCLYVASRRGYKGPRRVPAQNPNKRQATSPAETESTEPHVLPQSPSTSTPQGIAVGDARSPRITSTPVAQAADSSLVQSALEVFGGNASVSTPQSLGQRCLDSFYHHFHATHPFVLPKGYSGLLSQLNQDATAEPLLAAMRWVGSLYIDSEPFRSGLLEQAEALVNSSQRVLNGFLVQAMLLLVIGLDGSDQQDKARRLLGKVEAAAVQIGLNTGIFAGLHGRGESVLEESWRRTWWELYVVDAMFAGAHRSTNFALYDTPADVPLPCEEHQYISGDIPPSLTLQDLEDRDFLGSDHEFSSFAFRILSARNLGRFMRMPPMFGPEDENAARVETLLTNFRLHLPASKKYATRVDGKMDEMMFQALMLNHGTSLHLHQPLSQLDSSATQSINACAPHQVVQSWDVFNAHTRHTIASASEISKMITHQSPLTSHTHFFGCMVTASAIVHLSKWALFFVPHNDDDLRQQIRLSIGALEEISTVWRAAQRKGHQVRDVAQEIYRLKKQQHENSQYWLGFTQQQILESIATDDSILNDIEQTKIVQPTSSMSPVPGIANE